MGKAKKVVVTSDEAPVDEVRKVVGGDGLVDGETTHGEDVKGNSTLTQAPTVVESDDTESNEE